MLWGLEGGEFTYAEGQRREFSKIVGSFLWSSLTFNMMNTYKNRKSLNSAWLSLSSLAKTSTKEFPPPTT